MLVNSIKIPLKIFNLENMAEKYLERELFCYKTCIYSSFPTIKIDKGLHEQDSFLIKQTLPYQKKYHNINLRRVCSRIARHIGV